MHPHDLVIGQRVRFGRDNGQKSLGKIVKKNPSKVKVELLESRGEGRGSEVGSIWRVPYDMLYQVNEADEIVAPPAQPTRLSITELISRIPTGVPVMPLPLTAVGIEQEFEFWLNAMAARYAVTSGVILEKLKGRVS